MKSVIKTVQEGGITAHLRKDGIVQLYIKDHTQVTVQVLEELIEQLEQLHKDEIPLIVEAGEFITISQSAKNFALEFEKKARISSRALVPKNLAQKILVNYYYKSQKLKKPFQEFDSLTDAEKWIKENQQS